jgi:hypothetical protein
MPKVLRRKGNRTERDGEKKENDIFQTSRILLPCTYINTHTYYKAYPHIRCTHACMAKKILFFFWATMGITKADQLQRTTAVQQRPTRGGQNQPHYFILGSCVLLCLDTSAE